MSRPTFTPFTVPLDPQNQQPEASPEGHNDKVVTRFNKAGDRPLSGDRLAVWKTQ